jgi:hypothetical protein
MVGQSDNMAQTEHVAIRQAIMSMDTYGEGNYASTESSEDRGHKTDRGLTLPPKIQSSDPWPLNAAFSTDGLEDFEIFLGGFGSNNPFDDSYQRAREDSWIPTFAPEQTEERPRFTHYPSEELNSPDQVQDEKLAEDDKVVSNLHSLSNSAKACQEQQASRRQPSVASIPSPIPSPRPSPQLLPGHCKKSHNRPTVKRVPPPSSNRRSSVNFTKPASTGDEVSVQKSSAGQEPTSTRRDSGYGLSISDSAHDATLDDQGSVRGYTELPTFDALRLGRTHEHTLADSETCSVRDTSVYGDNGRLPSQDENGFDGRKNDLIAKLQLKTVDNTFPRKPSRCDIPIASIEKDGAPLPNSRNLPRDSSPRSQSLKEKAMRPELYLSDSLSERIAAGPNRAARASDHLEQSTHSARKNSFLASSTPLQTLPQNHLPNTHPTKPPSSIQQRLLNSLPIQLLLAMSDPSARSDTNAILLQAAKHFVGNGVTTIEHQIHTIPDELLASLNKLKWKFETDYHFRKSTLWWFAQNLTKVRGKSSFSLASSPWPLLLLLFSLSFSTLPDSSLLMMVLVDEDGALTSDVLPPATEDADLRSYVLAAQEQLNKQDFLIQSLQAQLQLQDSVIKSYDERLGRVQNLENSQAKLVRDLHFYKALAEANGSTAMAQELHSYKTNCKALLEEREHAKRIGRQAMDGYRKECGQLAQEVASLEQQLQAAQDYIATMKSAASLPTPPPTKKRSYAVGPTLPANETLRKKLCIERSWMRNAPSEVVNNQAVTYQVPNNEVINSAAVSEEAVNDEVVDGEEVNDDFINWDAINDEEANAEFVNNEEVNNEDTLENDMLAAFAQLDEYA